jgi:hypothetical protein
MNAIEREDADATRRLRTRRNAGGVHPLRRQPKGSRIGQYAAVEVAKAVEEEVGIGIERQCGARDPQIAVGRNGERIPRERKVGKEDVADAKIVQCLNTRNILRRCRSQDPSSPRFGPNTSLAPKFRI